jgi:hypothetical protein
MLKVLAVAMLRLECSITDDIVQLARYVRLVTDIQADALSNTRSWLALISTVGLVALGAASCMVPTVYEARQTLSHSRLAWRQVPMPVATRARC